MTDDIRTLLLKGFDIIGALFVGGENYEKNARKAIEASRRLRKSIFNDEGDYNMIGAAADTITGDIRFFVSDSIPTKIVEASNVFYDENPERYLWENGCLLRCELGFKLPIYLPPNKTSGSFYMIPCSFYIAPCSFPC